MDDPSWLHHQGKSALLFAILVKRLGGEVTFTQADIDEVAYDMVKEEGKDGKLVLTYIKRAES